MRPRGLFLAAVIVSAAWAGCIDPSSGATANPIEPCGGLEQGYEPSLEANPRLEMETTNGTMTVGVYGHQVPFTANHVRQLVQDGTWNQTRFHYLFPEEGIFGGDPRTSDDDRDAWGSGGYHFNVVDEHHQFLRHDQPGIVSLLSPEPNGAGSQFTITLSAQPDLDDRNPVFGKVVEGMDTARALAQTPTDDKGRPLYGAHLHNVTWIDPPQTDPDPPEVSAYGYDCVETAEPGDTAEYLVAVRNTGQSILEGAMQTSVDDEEGWNVSVRNADRLVVSAGQTVVYGVNVTVPESADPGTDKSIELTFEGTDEGVETSLELTTSVGQLGPPATDRDQVQVHYIGVLEDGRAFETTEDAYTDDEQVSWFTQRPSDPEPATLPADPEVLSSSQLGKLVERAQLGETVVGFVPPGEAYGTNSYGENGLGGRLLVFQVHVTST